MSKFLYLCSLVMIHIYGMREEDPNENLKRELRANIYVLRNFEQGKENIDATALKLAYDSRVKLAMLQIADVEDEITQFKPELMWGDEDGFIYIDENGIERSNPDPEGCYNSLWGCELILTKLSSTNLL